MTAESVGTRGHILLVDDEPQIRNLIVVALRRAGYDVTTAPGGREALARLAEASPDLLVSDIQMLDMDGLDLVRHVGADPRLRAVRVLLLSARDAPEDIIAGFALGADDSLPKPFAMAELMARVRVRLERPP